MDQLADTGQLEYVLLMAREMVSWRQFLKRSLAAWRTGPLLAAATLTPAGSGGTLPCAQQEHRHEVVPQAPRRSRGFRVMINLWFGLSPLVSRDSENRRNW